MTFSCTAAVLRAAGLLRSTKRQPHLLSLWAQKVRWAHLASKPLPILTVHTFPKTQLTYNSLKVHKPHLPLSIGTVSFANASLFCNAKQLFHSSALRREASQKPTEEKPANEETPKGDTSESPEEPEKLNFFVKEYRGLKHDIREFPDIYNAVNAFQFLIFSIFCLSSTGSQVEEQFWISVCGVDWAWSALLSPIAHCLLTTNFLSMALAMLLIHNLGHPVMNTVGSAFLMRYLGLVVLISGLCMLGLRKFLPEDAEVQYGPWDMVAALFVVSALTNGYMPLQLLASFNGWVKYAAFFGSAVILYYDWQPCLFGVAAAYGLHRFGIMKIPKIATV